jgi:O-antigen/teichoic acid export membrane protein
MCTALEEPPTRCTAAGPPSVRRVVRNGAFTLAAQVLQAASNLVAFFVVARGLGKEALGEFATLFALVMVVQVALEAGTATLLTRRVAQDRAAWRATVAEAAGLFGLIALASLAVFLGVGGAWALLAGDAALLPGLAAAGVACAAIQWQRFAAGVFRAFEEFAAENWARIGQGVLCIALVLGVVGQGLGGVATVLTVFAASHVAAALFLLASLQRRRGCPGWRWRRPRLRNWLAEAVPLGLGDMVRGPTWQLDLLLLGLLQPAAVVGTYSVAYRLLTPFALLARVVAAATFPLLARLAARSPALLDRPTAGVLRLLWVASLPLVVVVFVYAEPLIALVAGRQYLEAALPLRLLLGKAALALLSAQFGLLLALQGRQQGYVRLVLFVFVLEVVVELALIPAWGYLGACAGCVLGEVVFTVAGLALCRPRLGWKALLGPLPAAAAMGALLWSVQGLSWPLRVLAGFPALGLYLALCLLLGALRRQEVHQLFTALAGCFRPAARVETEPRS